jgi:membrane-bound ClpP family serine protease
MTIMLVLFGLTLGFITIYYGIKKMKNVVRKPVLLLPIILGLSFVVIFSFYMPITKGKVEAQRDHLNYEIKEILAADRIDIIEEDSEKLEILYNGERHKVYTSGKGKAREVEVITKDGLMIYQKDKIKNDLK